MKDSRRLSEDDLPILITRRNNQDFPYIKIEVDRNPDYPLENITKTQKQILQDQEDADNFKALVESKEVELVPKYELLKMVGIIERLKKRIELHKQIKKDIEEAEKHYLDIKLSDKEDMFKACQSDVLNELQEIEEGKNGIN